MVVKFHGSTQRKKCLKSDQVLKFGCLALKMYFFGACYFGQLVGPLSPWNLDAMLGSTSLIQRTLSTAAVLKINTGNWQTSLWCGK